MALIDPGSVSQTYDVIVVGSGAAGGQTAYTLTMDGARVLMLEAGRNYDPRTESPMFQTPDAAPLRAQGTPEKPVGLVWIAVSAADGRRLTRRLSLGGGRADIRDRTTTHALHLLRRLLLTPAPGPTTDGA